jgi:hypothetical protein
MPHLFSKSNLARMMTIEAYKVLPATACTVTGTIRRAYRCGSRMFAIIEK